MELGTPRRASRFTFNASNNHSSPPTTSAPGNTITPVRKPHLSATAPTIWGDHISPNKWIMKMESAIALDRKFTGTVSIMRVLVGPVDKNSRKIAPARNAIARFLSFTRSAATAAGVAAKNDPDNTHA